MTEPEPSLADPLAPVPQSANRLPWQQSDPRLTLRALWPPSSQPERQTTQGPPAAGPDVTALPGQATHERCTDTAYPAALTGVWDNPAIAAAMPLLLLIERLRNDPAMSLTTWRPRIGREIDAFQQTLSRKPYPTEAVMQLSYLLCTYIDGVLASLPTDETVPQSLLVEFHGDAWGGEKCFTHLAHYLTAAQQNREVLAFYDLILALGFEGKYQMLERGAVLLRDLRTHLHTLLYGQTPTQSLTDICCPSIPPRRAGIRASRLFGYGLLIALLIYGLSAWHLHIQARPLRHAILAWIPPEPRRITIMETLPAPLMDILHEGWLEVRRDPRGWLLIFTSDGAFHTGSARLSESFVQKRNIERLGLALAPWPGDLEVIGHTDNQPFRRASVNSNLRLSEARARTVANKLRETALHHAYPREIIAVGRGEFEPVADNATQAGRRRNRRVDILWKIGQRDADLTPEAYRERGE